MQTHLYPNKCPLRITLCSFLELQDIGGGESFKIASLDWKDGSLGNLSTVKPCTLSLTPETHTVE